jgi:L-seryl-tRNA(Ser) seleniumtransferase
VGFTEEASWAAVAALAHERGLWAVADLGSGSAVPGLVPGADEPAPADLLRAGFDVVCFSGDKALGGPQAGILLGRREPIDRLRRHPLLRALRVGRFTIAALEATLKRLLEGRSAEIPVVAALSLPAEAVRDRCRRLVRAARRAGAAGLDLRIVAVRSAVGGGAFPGGELPSWGVEVRRPGWSETAVEAMLRCETPPILGRLAEGRLVLDLRTLLPGQDAAVVASLGRLAAAPDPGEAARTGGFDGGRGPEEDAGGDAPGDG